MLENAETTTDHSPAVELSGVTKRFGHVQALTGVDLQVRPGEILALLGDNGAGKSTLVKVMAGLHRPDEGEVRVNGVAQRFHSPSDARAAGVATVYQDLGLVECLDVATNMFLGQIPKRRFLVDRRRMLKESAEFLDALGVTVGSVRTQIGMLSGGQRQIVAFARVLRLGAGVVLLDEPTAALGVRETAQAVGLIRSLRDRGKAVVLVTHDIDVVFSLADRIQVLRLGRVAGVRDVATTDRDEIVGLITGARGDHFEEAARRYGA
jgi:ABC-type sugar transport system ATPase subunit